MTVKEFFAPAFEANSGMAICLEDLELNEDGQTEIYTNVSLSNIDHLVKVVGNKRIYYMCVYFNAITRHATLRLNIE